MFNHNSSGVYFGVYLQKKSREVGVKNDNKWSKQRKNTFTEDFNHNSTEKNIKSCEESSHHDHDYFLVHRDSGTVHERLLLVKIMITSHIILSKIEN